MGKISPVSAKYIVHTQIQIDGVVDKPDIVGAIFGQTEGLLGEDLELRELQRSGRIGRIEVKSETRSGKSFGSILIPSSLDKAETAIIGAALETIQRIGPCNAKVKVEKIEDVRISKRTYVIERAKELLKTLTDSVLPDSQEITDEVAQSVRMLEISEYGRDRLPAGPTVDESDEIIVVEGRADVLNLLKHGFKNVIGMSGTNIPESIVELCRRKTITLFVDGDRGGDLILKELSERVEIDYVCKAPDGKEVEEITKKEIHKALRGKVAVEQVKLDLGAHKENGAKPLENVMNRKPVEVQRYERKPDERYERKPIETERYERKPFIPQQQRKPRLNPEETENFKTMMDNLIGTKGAYLLDENSNILGKVPTTELMVTLKSLNNVYAIIMDGEIDRELVSVAERAKVKYVVGTESKVRPHETRITVLTSGNLTVNAY